MKKRIMAKTTGLILATVLICVQPMSVLAVQENVPGRDDNESEYPMTEAEGMITASDSSLSVNMLPSVHDVTDPEWGEMPLTTEQDPEETSSAPGYDVEKIREALIEHDILSSLKNMTPGKDYAEGQVIISAEDREYAEHAAEVYGGSLVSFEYGLGVIGLPDSLSVYDAVSKGLNAADPSGDGSVDYPPVEPDYFWDGSPDLPDEDPQGSLDPSGSSAYDRLYGTYVKDPFLDPTNARYQWFHDMINTYEAWDYTTGSSNVTVAVIDSGVSAHTEFGSRLSTPSDYTSGKTDLVDTSGHGTNVAGIIGAGLNSAGGAGVAPNVKLMSLPTGTKDGPKSSYVLSAINYASTKKADVANISIGMALYSAAIDTAVNNAYKKGLTIVASAGNDSSNGMNYPGAYDHVIAVAAADKSGSKAGFSNPGSYVDVAAPGVNMWSTWNGADEENPVTSFSTQVNDYISMSGTSQASPVVTGACALYMSVYGHTTPDNMEKVIRSSVSGSPSPGLGAGIIDLGKMFTKDLTPPVINIGKTDKGTIPYNRSITMTGGSAATKCAGLEKLGGKIIYTVNGGNPQVKDGKIVNGTQYSSAITVESLLVDHGLVPGKSITIKAASITGTGVMSRISSVTFKVSDTATALSITTKPASISAGSSYRFQASVTPAGSTGLVTWEITSKGKNLTGAKINAKTGDLTTKSGQTGNITVKCTSKANKTLTAQHSFAVQNGLQKVKKIELKASKLNVRVGATGTVQVASITDINGQKISTTSVKYQWTVSNESLATLSSTDSDKVTVTAKKKGSVTVTCRVLDGSDRTAACKVSLIIPVSKVAVAGQSYMAPGSKARFKAVITPGTAGNKTVKWSLSGAPKGVTIDQKSGNVSVSKDVSIGSTFTVKAAATDGSGKSGTLLVTVSKQATEVRIQTSGTVNKDALIPVSKNSSLISARLYTVNVNGGTDESTVTLRSVIYSGSSTLGTNASWSSSNPSVVSVGTSLGASTTIRALNPGSAKITCSAGDGSGKSASVSVKVIIPTSRVSLSSAKGQETIAAGCSAQTKATFGNLHGKPSVRDLDWDFRVVNTYSDTGVDNGILDHYSENAYLTTDVKQFGLVGFSKGNLSFSKKAFTLFVNYSVTGYMPAIIVTAKAKDGTGCYGEYAYILSGPATYMKVVDTDKKPVKSTYGKVNLEMPYVLVLMTDCSGRISTKSSNPAAVSVSVKRVSGAYLIFVCCLKKGSSNITFKSTDGSNKSCSVNIKAT